MSLQRYVKESSQQVISRNTANQLSVEDLLLVRPLYEYDEEVYRHYENENDILRHSFFFDECKSKYHDDIYFKKNYTKKNYKNYDPSELQCKHCKICKDDITFIMKKSDEFIDPNNSSDSKELEELELAEFMEE